MILDYIETWYELLLNAKIGSNIWQGNNLLELLLYCLESGWLQKLCRVGTCGSLFYETGRLY